MSGAIARFEIGARNAERLRSFYTHLFGWHTDGDLLRCGQGIDGRMFDPPNPIPPYVGVYVEAENLDEMLEDARRLGATVYVPPTPSPLSIESAFAVIGDPDGTIVGLSAHSPVAMQVHPNGTRRGMPVVWFEIGVSDRDRARAFYSELFGWGFAPFDGYDPEYLIIDTGVGSIGGGLVTPRDGAQPVCIFVGVDDLEETIEEAAGLGASVEQGPTIITEAAGSFARLRDPDGFRFGIWTA